MEKNIRIFKLSSSSCIVYNRLMNHKVNVQCSFKFGELQLIENSNLYWAELDSLECLNKEIDWSRRFFEELDGSMGAARVETNEEDQFTRVVVLEREGMTMLRAVVRYQVGKDPKKFMFDQYKEYIRHKSNALTALKIQKQAEKAVYEQNLIALEKQQVRSQTEKQTLLLKLSALYVAKKNKLCEIQDEDSSFNPSQTSQVQELPDELDHTMGATLFVQSQHFR